MCKPVHGRAGLLYTLRIRIAISRVSWLAALVNLTKRGITWEQSSNEGLSTLSWPEGKCVRACPNEVN